MHQKGIEPPHLAPEASALSTELLVHKCIDFVTKSYSTINQPKWQGLNQEKYYAILNPLC